MTQSRVVYVVVDGMSTEAFEQATASGRAPALAYIKDRGAYVRDSVSVFPTITPAATASLVTGETPARHGIPGMCWYDRDAQRFVNYGQSPRAAVVEGVKQVVHDVLHNLNARHLSSEVATIHEQLHDLGLVTASMNFMVFRGPVERDLQPGIVKRLLFRKALPDRISGPAEHYFADVLSGPADAAPDLLSCKSVEARLHATDAWAAQITRNLLEKEAADMIVFYLHENDHMSHRHGPGTQVDTLAKADEHIAHVLESYGSWDETLDRVGFVITADHSQSPISSEDDHIVALEDVLADFELVCPGRGKERFENDKDVAVAGNGRVGFVYLNEDRKNGLRPSVIHRLLDCDATDQVMWRDGHKYRIESERGALAFWEAESEGIVDERGNKWSFEGDLAAVSGVVEESAIRTPEYPLAFWRIKCALDLDRIGDIVVTAKLTYEFSDLAGGDHKGGGDHASLHVQDSIVPFVSTLAEPPLHPSTVDVVPHIVRHFERLRSA